MGAKRRFMIFSMEGIVTAMKPGRDYQAGNIATCFGARVSDVRRFLQQAVDEGLIDKVRTSNRTEYVFRLTWSEQTTTDNIAPPAYRDRKLSETLVDYDRTLHDFGALCMLSRKP